jgi:hypothetical protein
VVGHELKDKVPSKIKVALHLNTKRTVPSRPHVMFELDSFHVHNKPERARIIFQFYSQNKIKFNEFLILICMRIHYQERLILNGTHQLLAYANDNSTVE